MALLVVPGQVRQICSSLAISFIQEGRILKYAKNNNAFAVDFQCLHSNCGSVVL